MEKFKILIQEYKDNPNVETQQNVAKFYIKYKNNEDLKEELTVFIKQDSLKGGIEWYNFFEGDKNLWKEIFLMKQEQTAQKYLIKTLNQGENNQDFLDMSVDMCEASCSGTRDIQGFNVEIENVWINVFHRFADFKEKIEQSKKQKKEKLAKYLSELNIPVIEKQPTILVLKMTVPVMCHDDSGNVVNFEKVRYSEKYEDFMRERSKYFNSFNLQEYMEFPQCNEIILEVKENLNFFTIKLNNAVDIQKLRNDLLGQLSDGLGENLSQQPLIIENNQYYFDFDIKKASQLLEIKEMKEQKKLRIK